MSPPIDIDGSEIQEATIDGQDVSEITIDGQQAADFIDIPDSGLLQAHWDATQLSGFNDGDSVATFPDQTDDGYDLSADGSPTYKTNRIGGEPIVRGDGVDDRFDVAYDETVSQPHNIFVVAQGQNLTTGDAERIVGGHDSNNRHDLSSSTSDNWRMFAGSGIDDGSDDEIPHIFGFLVDGPNSVLRIDGTAVATGDVGSDSSSGMQVFDTFDIGQHGEFDIGEILHYHSPPTVSDVESFLSNKWGITI